MVGKVAEVSLNVAMDGDSTPDDNALLKKISKKKKQEPGGEERLPLAMFPANTLVRLTTALSLRGGIQNTDKQTGKEDVALSSNLVAETQQIKKGDSQRRQVALTDVDRMAMLHAYKKTESAQKGEVNNALTSKVEASVYKSATNQPTIAATNMLLDGAAKPQQLVTAQQSQAASLATSAISNKSTQETDTRDQKKQLCTKDEFNEARPFLQGTKQGESVLPKQGETAAQSKDSPATLQQRKAQASLASAVRSENQSQTLEVNYQFQRWSGDHSVRISVPTEARRGGYVVLLPSDARAADVLQRNMALLTGLNPDLLRPQQERDEQQQRRQQQQQDEDLE